MLSIDASTPLSLAHLSEIEVAPLALLEAAAEAGFSSIGIRTSPASPGGPAYPLATTAEQDALSARMAETDVSILYVELISLTEETRAKNYTPMLQVAAELKARRLCVAGDGHDFPTMAKRMAEVCDLAAEFNLDVDLEFMPYRGVATLTDAVEVIERTDRENAFVLVDALHFYRSGSTLAQLRATDPKLLGTFQICDGPIQAPADLVAEARLNRLLPGQGEFPLLSLLEALPDHLPVGVEVPLYTSQPNLPVADRLSKLVQSTRNFVA
ncbi:MAG: sugar phosphate isomerase/epimerase family protein [Hyphomicrobiaceae bacterium]